MNNTKEISIESELKNKVYFLQKALEECSKIIKILEKQNASNNKINSKQKQQDLSKIRGD